MRKFLFLAALVAIAGFTSCAQDDIEGGLTNVGNGENVSAASLLNGPTRVEIPNGVSRVKIVNWADRVDLGTVKVEDNHILICSPNGYTTVMLYNADVANTGRGAANAESGYLGEATIKRSKANNAFSQSANVLEIPGTAEMLNHWKTAGGLDVEARYTGDGHDYLRLAYPLRSKSEVTVNLESFEQYCEMDDTRIVTRNDVEVLYAKDGEVKETADNKIVLKNENTSSEYHKVIAKLNTDDADGIYQLKVELYPKSEEEYNNLITFIESNDLGSYVTDAYLPTPEDKVNDYLAKLTDEYPNEGLTTFYASRYNNVGDALKTDDIKAVAATAKGTVLCVVRQPFSGSESIVRLLYVDADSHIYEWNFTTKAWEHASQYCVVD